MKHSIKKIKRKLLITLAAVSLPLTMAMPGLAGAHGGGVSQSNSSNIYQSNHRQSNNGHGGGNGNSQRFSLLGDAKILEGNKKHGNIVRLRSDDDPGFGGIDFKIKNNKTFADLKHLSTEYNVTNDDCGAGSPRFQLETDEGNIFVYIGPSPNFTDCEEGWQSTGELIGNNDAGRYDYSQIIDGSQVKTYDEALADVGDKEILSIQLVVDSGWNEGASGGDGEQTVRVDNIVINNKLFTFDQKKQHDDCEEDEMNGFSSSNNRSNKYGHSHDCEEDGEGGRHHGQGSNFGHGNGHRRGHKKHHHHGGDNWQSNSSNTWQNNSYND
jgi:hypothetical protein